MCNRSSTYIGPPEDVESYTKDWLGRTGWDVFCCRTDVNLKGSRHKIGLGMHHYNYSCRRQVFSKFEGYGEFSDRKCSCCDIIKLCKCGACASFRSICSIN